MFVRDPFRRALSGYTDNFFQANTLYWRILGTHIINITRSDPLKKSLQCGHDVTFPEYVKYLIHSEKTNTFRNRHFFPMHKHCAPCVVQYDVIGKLETMRNDTDYIYDVLNIRHNMTLRRFQSETDHYRVDFLINQMYSMKKRIVPCMPFYEAMLRLWKSFQIRGFLAKNVSISLKREKADRMEKNEFKKIVSQAYTESGNKQNRRGNQQDAFREAFGMVPIEDLEQLSAVFKTDCELFEYNCRPPEIFDRSHQVNESWYFKID